LHGAARGGDVLRIIFGGVVALLGVGVAMQFRLVSLAGNS
jgi:hypothetical protein